MLLSFALRKSIFPKKSLAHRRHGYFVIVHTLLWITILEWTLWTYKRDIVKRCINCYQFLTQNSNTRRKSIIQCVENTHDYKDLQNQLSLEIHNKEKLSILFTLLKKEPVIIVILTGYILLPSANRAIAPLFLNSMVFGTKPTWE